MTLKVWFMTVLGFVFSICMACTATTAQQNKAVAADKGSGDYIVSIGPAPGSLREWKDDCLVQDSKKLCCKEATADVPKCCFEQHEGDQHVTPCHEALVTDQPPAPPVRYKTIEVPE